MIRTVAAGTLPSTVLVCAVVALGAVDPPKDAPAKEPPAKETPAADTAKPGDAPAAAPPTVVRSDNVLHCTAQKDLPREKLRFLGEEWNTELCLDDASRSTGMGARTEFPAGTAMLFVYPQASLLSFWMKDCLIDMDMVFVDAQGVISGTHEAKRQPLRKRGQTLEVYETSLKRYSSNRRAQFCIELPAGSLKRLKPALGTKIDLDWKAIAARAK